MTPINDPSQSAPWWQTVVTTLVNLGVGILVNHFLGTPAAGVSLAAGTAIAHTMPSPSQQIAKPVRKRVLY